MNDIVKWLEEELRKRTGQWKTVDAKGNELVKEPLQTCIVISPNQAIDLLSRITNEEKAQDTANSAT